ncbi:MAG: trypsin-like peptidase domain-containing protein [Bdellovibrionales bacterium]|nr:trypsin-like peptidase domain-containing protein [Bdellovibrionales bacterium]
MGLKLKILFVGILLSSDASAYVFFKEPKKIPEAPSLPSVVYGTDDRGEILPTTHPILKAAFASTANMIPSRSIFKNPSDGSFTIDSRRLGDTAALCKGEPFADQFAPGECTGFLITEDLLLTAGHCVPTQMECTFFNWVFDFKQDLVGTAALPVVQPDQVYSCKRILAVRTQIIGEDWSLVELDRPVTGRAGLPIRKTGTVADVAAIGTVGYPNGIPAKAIDNGFIRTNTDPNFFTAVLDTFGGNSGSPILNLVSGEVEGLLISGEDDFEEDKRAGCWRVKKCTTLGCKGETVLRVTTVRNTLAQLMLPELTKWLTP